MPFLSLHVACLAVFFVPLTAPAVLLCVLLYLVRMFGITAGYHRYFSHRSYKTSRWFQFALACLGCSAMQKGPLWWTAHHRDHHRHSDTAQDPHSPRTNSFWWSHIGWILAHDYEETGWPAVRDWGRLPELRWLNRYHWVPGLTLAALCFLAGGWSGLVWGFLVSTVLLFHAVFAVNSLCHLIGRRPYGTADQSRNNLAVALLTLGEGWHNNHHHYQSSANQGFRWWQIDVCYYVIRLLGCVGLVWHIRTAPRARRAATQRGLAGRTPARGTKETVAGRTTDRSARREIRDQRPREADTMNTRHDVAGTRGASPSVPQRRPSTGPRARRPQGPGTPSRQPEAPLPGGECLIADARAGLTTTQMVDAKLLALLGYVPLGRGTSAADERRASGAF